MRVLVIHNPSSGPHTGDIEDFVRSAAQPGDEFVIRLTTSLDDIGPMTADAGSFDAVVASGGDGTVSSVAYAIRTTGTPMMAYPSGTANLFVNNLGVATEPSALARTLRCGRLAKLDLGELTYVDDAGRERVKGFQVMAGTGYDASIMKESEGLKSQFGQLSYYLSAFGIPNPTRAHFDMTLDGTAESFDGICVLVGQWGWVGPQFQLIPKSDPQDGLLDVAMVKTQNATSLIAPVIGSIFSGGQGVVDHNIEVRHVREMELRCDPPLPMQFDGEVIHGAKTPLRVRALPGALTTFVDELSPLYATASEQRAR